jgi:hypothetical protein
MEPSVSPRQTPTALLVVPLRPVGKSAACQSNAPTMQLSRAGQPGAIHKVDILILKQ